MIRPHVSLRLAWLLLLVAGLSACAMLGPPEARSPVIPLPVLFGGGDLGAGTLSPDGRQVAFLAPHGREWSVWVAPTGKPEARRAVVTDTRHGLRGFMFSATGSHLLYVQDDTGEENDRWFAVDLATLRTVPLSHRGVRAKLAGLSGQFPGEVLLEMNERDYRQFDLVRVSLADGSRRTVFENTGFSTVITDGQFRLRYAVAQTDDGGSRWFVRAGEDWKPWSEVPQADALATRMLGLSADGRTLFTLDSRGRQTAALYAVDTATGTRRLLHADPQADVDDVIRHPATGAVQAVSTRYLRRRWVALDPEFAIDLERLQKFAAGGELNIRMRSGDERTWVVSIDRADATTKVYLYDRPSGVAKLWYDTQPALARYDLVPMHGVEIRARDGLVLPSYLSLPPGSDLNGDGRPERPLPLVLLVHGGPWMRDQYGLDSTHQWLANRGYAVLSVNFRGSTGLGKALANGGDKEWGRKMNDDLLDAADWAAGQGIAQRDKVAVMGASYGGYAALAALSTTPQAFACGVSVVGPSNLISFIEAVPGYWDPWLRTYSSRVGDPDTVAGRALLAERSPLTHAQRIERPLLIGHGTRDPRVKQAESDQMVEALQRNGVPVVYVVYPDEGHGFGRFANRISFNSVTERFLRQCLRAGTPGTQGWRDEDTTIWIRAGESFLTKGFPGRP